MYGGINSCAPMSYVPKLDMKSVATLQNYRLKANRWPGDDAEGLSRISSGTFNFLELIPHIENRRTDRCCWSNIKNHRLQKYEMGFIWLLGLIAVKTECVCVCVWSLQPRVV